MPERDKVTLAHLQRQALVYVRQSSASQVENNKESQRLQYALVNRAHDLGWSHDHIAVVDEDLGVTANGMVDRAGFEHVAAEVVLGHIGLILGIEVSRLSRSNADWYRLLDLCAITDTLVGDSDGLYHPGAYNDRLLLGLKGTLAEAELHVLRARLLGGIRNKAQRGELRRNLPVGLIWGDHDGEVRCDPDEAVTQALRTVFQRFAEFGSVRRVWLWFRSEQLPFPRRRFQSADIEWVQPSYNSVHAVLSNPVYAGAYVYGKSSKERYLDEAGRVRRRTRRLPREQWRVFLPEHHTGFIDWATYLDNQARLASNTHPQPHIAGGAVREGPALLQGLVSCGRCGRHLHTTYKGRTSTARYYCSAGNLNNGSRCLSFGGCQVERAVTQAVLAALTPAGMEAALVAAEHLEHDVDAALGSWRVELERTRYEAARAERRYRAVDPDNRLVARGLEADWEAGLRQVATAEAALAERERTRPRTLTQCERDLITTLGRDLELVWSAPSTTNRDRKELLHLLLEDLIVTLSEDRGIAHVKMCWQGGATTELEVNMVVHRSLHTKRTDEGTINLLRRLAVHYPDGQIASILNQQGRRTASGEHFNSIRVAALRNHHGIPRHQPDPAAREGELLTISKAAAALGIAASTLHRWLADGFVAGEQLTPTAPWRIRMTDSLRALFTDQAPPGWVPMQEATKALGVSRQTVLQRVKRGELCALHLRSGRRKGLRIELPAGSQTPLGPLFNNVMGSV